MNKATLVFRYTPRKGNGIIGIGSYLIRKITKSNHDHVERLIGDYVYSGTQKGVRKMLFTEWQKLYKNQRHTITEIKVTFTEELFLLFFEKVKGARYDYWSLLMHLLYRASGKWLGKGRDGSNAFYCSEFVSYASGINKWWEMDVKALEDYASDQQ